MTHTDDALVDGTSIDEFIANERARDPEFAAEWDKTALTEAVAKALYEYDANRDSHRIPFMPWDAQASPRMDELRREFRMQAHVAIAAIRQHDEQAALNCGHCDPNTDEIACQCKIEERDDE